MLGTLPVVVCKTDGRAQDGCQYSFITLAAVKAHNVGVHAAHRTNGFKPPLTNALNEDANFSLIVQTGNVAFG